MYKRFWLFAGSHYYPCGGMYDFHGSYTTLEEAKDALRTVKECDWAHVLDSETGERFDTK